MTDKELKEKQISAISLGCDKNRVDLEHMLGKLKDFGFNIVSDLDEAQIIIVNTCAFILPAVKEAIENILLAVSKKQNKCEKVIVTGCINERYTTELKNSLKEVDCFVKLKDNDDIVKIIMNLYGLDIKDKFRSNLRLLTTHKHYAYLKIADGCNNGCAYCTIPRIRGRYRSVDIDELYKEAKQLAKQGVKELILVAQDITRYGEDIYNKNSLIDLLEKLSKIKEIEWIRLHYLYPEKITDQFLDYINNNQKICKYLDIPLQHIDDKILFDMNRKCDEKTTRVLIDKIKNSYPNFTIRSTFIVGFPGETKKQFNKLLDFIMQSNLQNVGFFPFYKEEKTKAFYMKKQVPNFIKKRRLNKIQKLQQQIADNLNKKRINQVVKVLIDEFDTNSGFYIGRDEFNSPGVDFCIEILDNNNVECGQFYNVKLTDYSNGIFKGEIIWICQIN